MLAATSFYGASVPRECAAIRRRFIDVTGAATSSATPSQTRAAMLFSAAFGAAQITTARCCFFAMVIDGVAAITIYIYHFTTAGLARYRFTISSFFQLAAHAVKRRR